jgi:DNA-binding XRE family transcriptional regulator
MTPLAKLIEDRMLKKGKIAEKVGIAPQTFSKIVKGESIPTLKVALKLAKVLEMSVEHLWGHLIEEENKEKEGY